MSALATHLEIAIDDASRVGEARRTAVRLAETAGFDEVASGRVALVITELATNLVRHASHGRLLLAPRHDAVGPAVEVLSLDDGPGMADVQRCLADGYSTGGTAGTGFGAVQRLAHEFDLFSRPGAGTVIAVTLRAGPLAEISSGTAWAPGSRLRLNAVAGGAAAEFVVGAIALCAPGELVCGDAAALSVDGKRLALMLADGLGHGPDAAAAAATAIERFDALPGELPSDLLEAAHGPMRATRGAAVSVAVLDATSDTITFCGVGNVMGRIVSGVGDRSLLSNHGTLGLQIRRLQDTVYPWPAHGVFVMHSDGIVTRWDLSEVPAILQCHPLVIAGWLIRAHTRGRDDASVVVVRRA